MHISQNGTYTDLTFATWMAYNIPPMIVNVVIAWIYLVVVFFGIPFTKKVQNSRMMSKENQKNVEEFLHEKYRNLGKMTFHELAVATLFLFAVCLWLFREPRFIPGWSSMIKGNNSEFGIGDSTPAMLVVMLLFIVPKNPISIFRSKSDP